MKALIVIAHGSKKEKSNQEFLNLINDLSKYNKSYKFILPAFLEFTGPSIEDCVKKLLLKNCSTIVFYPFFLNSGKHVIVDIPNIINELTIKYPNVNCKILSHFGKSDKIKEIILNDIK